MNRQQIDLVRQSFARLAPIAPQAAALFYDNLFAADPTLRTLFQGSMARQGESLMAMIGRALGMLDHPSALLPALRSLGARHLRYGVKDSHYPTVGMALMKTLEQGLGDTFTLEVQRAWLELYGVIARSMQDGAREASTARL